MQRNGAVNPRHSTSHVVCQWPTPIGEVLAALLVDLLLHPAPRVEAASGCRR